MQSSHIYRIVRCHSSVNKNDGYAAISRRPLLTAQTPHDAHVRTRFPGMCVYDYTILVCPAACTVTIVASDKVRCRRAENERLGLKSDVALTYRVIVWSLTVNYLDRFTRPTVIGNLNDNSKVRSVVRSSS